jgi:1,4-dihydroxy-2-naphthoyl-CoA hydrolase
MTAPDDASAYLNEHLDGWNRAMGVRFVRATTEEVEVEWMVGPQHLQGYGIVHGGVYAGVIETITSVGAALVAMGRGQSVVGLENSTSFVRAVREGKLRGVATPVTRGRRTQVWEGTILDPDGHTVATGRVRLLCLEPDTVLAGKKATRQTGDG